MILQSLQYSYNTYTKGKSKGYARPLILFILPGSVNCNGRKFLLTGQENTTSPPPSGGAPLFTICDKKSQWNDNTCISSFSEQLCTLIATNYKNRLKRKRVKIPQDCFGHQLFPNSIVLVKNMAPVMFSKNDLLQSSFLY